jgi:glycosyltransferase involved in cell wall biosynthesis
MTKKVSVIVTVKNEAKTIEALLSALYDQTVLPTEVIITDAFSEDETVSVIEKFTKNNDQFPITVKQMRGNRSVGRNAAISFAKNDLIAISDAGCIPSSKWLEELLSTYTECQKEDDQTVIAGYAEGKAQTSLQRAAAPYFLVMPDKVDPHTYLPATRSMLISKQVWQKVGKFDESLNTSEDYIFAQQLKKHHIKICFNKDALVYWSPPKNLQQIAKTFVSFAAADVVGGVLRPKVVALFGRYFLGVIGLILIAKIFGTQIAFIFVAVGLLFYGYWAIRKNARYVGKAWYWLPVLQFLADVTVMIGSLFGFGQRLLHSSSD